MQHTHKELKKKKKSQPYPRNTTETGCFEMLNTVYLRHQDKFQAKILAGLCVEEYLSTIFLFIYTSKAKMK